MTAASVIAIAVIRFIVFAPESGPLRGLFSTLLITSPVQTPVAH